MYVSSRGDAYSLRYWNCTASFGGITNVTAQQVCRFPSADNLYCSGYRQIGSIRPLNTFSLRREPLTTLAPIGAGMHFIADFNPKL